MLGVGIWKQGCFCDAGSEHLSFGASLNLGKMGLITSVGVSVAVFGDVCHGLLVGH